MNNKNHRFELMLGLKQGLGLGFGLWLLLIQMAHAAELQGVIDYPQSIEITSPITGIVLEHAAVGQLHRQNTSLAKFDSTIIKSKLKNLKQIQLLKQKVLTEAERELQRSQELYEGTMLSDHELKLAEVEFLKAKNDLAKTLHKITKLQWKKQFYQTKAPFDGYIVESFLYPGKYVANRYVGTPLMKFIKADNLLIDILIARLGETNLAPGKELGLQIDGKNYSAKLLSVLNRDNETRLQLQLKSTVAEIPGQGSMVSISY